jgi:hypothetical protein
MPPGAAASGLPADAEGEQAHRPRVGERAGDLVMISPDLA